MPPVKRAVPDLALRVLKELDQTLGSRRRDGARLYRQESERANRDQVAAAWQSASDREISDGDRAPNPQYRRVWRRRLQSRSSLPHDPDFVKRSVSTCSVQVPLTLIVTRSRAGGLPWPLKAAAIAAPML
jgi:hypothetical protein